MLTGVTAMCERDYRSKEEERVKDEVERILKSEPNQRTHKDILQLEQNA